MGPLTDVASLLGWLCAMKVGPGPDTLPQQAAGYKGAQRRKDLSGSNVTALLLAEHQALEMTV